MKEAFVYVAAQLNGVLGAGERVERYETLLVTTNALIAELADELLSLSQHGAIQPKDLNESVKE